MTGGTVTSVSRSSHLAPLAYGRSARLAPLCAGGPRPDVCASCPTRRHARRPRTLGQGRVGDRARGAMPRALFRESAPPRSSLAEELGYRVERQLMPASRGGFCDADTHLIGSRGEALAPPRVGSCGPRRREVAYRCTALHRGGSGGRGRCATSRTEGPRQLLCASCHPVSTPLSRCRVASDPWVRVRTSASAPHTRKPKTLVGSSPIAHGRNVIDQSI